MTTKMKLPSPPSWPWPSSCNQLKTLSFRAADDGDTINSDIITDEDVTNSIETTIQELSLRSSDRLFFEPGKSSSIIEEANSSGYYSIMSMDSDDPYGDFRKSMEEMIEANNHGMKKWVFLQELLSCYLRMNGKENHEFIVCAFLDLLVSISFDDFSSSSSSSSCSNSSPSSFYNSSPCCSSSLSS